MARVLLAACFPALALAAWGLDGGSTYRQGVALLAGEISSTQPRTVLTYTETTEEDVESMVEEQLLFSPVVSSDGYVVLVTDTCAVSVLPDPTTLNEGARWAPVIGGGATWSPSKADPEFSLDECFAAGLVLDSSGDTDVVYFLDKRNQALHSLSLSGAALTYQVRRGWDALARTTQRPSPTCPSVVHPLQPYGAPRRLCQLRVDAAAIEWPAVDPHPGVCG